MKKMEQGSSNSKGEWINRLGKESVKEKESE